MSRRTWPSDLIDRLVARLRQEEPDLQAVLLAGSVARREDDPYSDIDLVALTLGPPRRGQRTWFERTPEGRLLHISIEADRLSTPHAEPAAGWSIGFPAMDVQEWVWATTHAKAVLGDDPSRRLPAGSPELEDFIELSLKVARAVSAGDRIRLRWWSRVLAEYTPALLREFNPERTVNSPEDALAAALSFPNAPRHYHEDFEVCAGLTPASDAEIGAAATRLVSDLLSYLKERYRGGNHSSDEMRAALVAGTVDAYLAQDRTV